MLKAIDLQPHNGFYAEAMTRIYEKSGHAGRARAEAARAAELLPGSANSQRLAARFAVKAGDEPSARYWFGRMVAADPQSAAALAEAALFHAAVGDLARADALLVELQRTGSTNPEALRLADKAIELVGG